MAFQLKKLILKSTVFYFIMFIFTLTVTYAQKQFHFAAGITNDNYEKGVMILRIKSDYRNLCNDSYINSSDLIKVFNKLSVTEVKKKFPHHKPPVEGKTAFGFPLTDLSLIYAIKFNIDIPIEKAASMLLSCKEVQYADPSFIDKLLYIPNDTLAIPQYQYHHVNIHTFDGWDIQKGDTNIVIGITDTGVDTAHIELINQLKYNYADPINGIDDDGDGYIDNYRGWNVAFNSNDVQGSVPLHGNFVAGISNAEVDNVTGIAGVGFKTKFLPVSCSPGSNVIVNGYDAIVYAADHGCSVINCSWGGFGSSQFSQDVINYATFNKNALVVAAAGNANNDAPFFPASYQYVLSVGGTDSADVKWTSSPTSGSSFGSYVDVTAPGDKIFSIFPTNSNPPYWYSGGTSEAAPQVSAIAALVKAQFPTLNALQIGERIRATCDDIYSIPGNAPFINMLGKGRVNLLNALTQPATSVRAFDIKNTDNNDNAFSPNDTVRISAVFFNLLNPVSNLSVTIQANNPDISFLNNSFLAGSMATMQSDSNRSNPFLAVIDPSIPKNTKVVFTMTFTAGTYVDIQQFEMTVNVDYINVLVNDIGVSITSKGRIGFNDSGNSQGIGFTQNEGPNLLYSGSLMIGVNDSMVSDAVAGTPAGAINEHFAPIDYVHAIVPSVVSEFDLTTKFNDNNNSLPIGVNVSHNTYVWSTPAERKFVVAEYIITNNSNNTYSDLYAGIYADWDITENTYATNRAMFDSTLNMGYAFEVTASNNYTAIKLLTPGIAHYYAYNNDGSDGSVNIYDGFSKQEKYQSMNGSGRAQAGMNGNGTDISMLLSSGPFLVLPNDSVKVAFALLGGDSLNEIEAAATAAQIKYNTVGISEVENQGNAILVYPNPAAAVVNVHVPHSTSGSVKIKMYDTFGNLVTTKTYLQKTKNTLQTDISNLSNGIYFLRFTSNQINKTIKINILHDKP